MGGEQNWISKYLRGAATTIPLFIGINFKFPRGQGVTFTLRLSQKLSLHSQLSIFLIDFMCSTFENTFFCSVRKSECGVSFAHILDSYTEA